jgi:hypothetical protein
VINVVNWTKWEWIVIYLESAVKWREVNLSEVNWSELKWIVQGRG